MEKKMIWGLATLILLLGIAAVFLFIDKDTETKPEYALGQPTKDLLKQGVKSPQQANVSDTQKPPPPDDGREYVWHGNHWDPVDAPKLVDSLFEAPELKSDLPDELPADLPTDAEIQQMSYEDLDHLKQLLNKEVEVLSKTDIVEAARLQHISVAMGTRMFELSAKSRAKIMARHRAFMEKLPIRLPQTEESPALIIEATPPPNDQNEGGTQ